MTTTNPVSNAGPPGPLIISIHRARIELLGKKVGFLALIIIQGSAIAGVCAAIILYSPLPTQSLLVSPFIGGVFTALALLKVPTFNITPVSYQTYTNPTALVGDFLTLVLFGGLLYIKDKIDFNNYSDPIVANSIREDLLTASLERFYEVYADKGRIRNLKNFNYINQDQVTKMKAIYAKYEPLFLSEKTTKKAFFQIFSQGPQSENKIDGENKTVSENKIVLEDLKTPFGIQCKQLKIVSIKALEDDWAELQNDLRVTLPQPAGPDLTFFSNRAIYTFHQLIV